MIGGAIFWAFLVFFTVATLVVPIPLFPGSIIVPLLSPLGIPVSFNAPLVDALVNGTFYGLIVWIVFVSASRKLEEPKATNNPSTHAHSTYDNLSCPVHFGYLRELSPYSSILEECYSCPRIENCMND